MNMDLLKRSVAIAALVCCVCCVFIGCGTTDQKSAKTVVSTTKVVSTSGDSSKKEPAATSAKTDDTKVAKPVAKTSQEKVQETVKVAEEVRAKAMTDRFQTNDLVVVQISNIPNAQPAHEERIKDDGTLTLPLVGSYIAVGKTQSEVQSELTELYGKYYKNHVVIVSSEARYFYVTGEVKIPGDKRYVPNMTFLRAIASAGGYSTFAANTVRVTNAKGEMREVNAKKIRKNPALDFPIWPGDVIDVPKR